MSGQHSTDRSPRVPTGTHHRNPLCANHFCSGSPSRRSPTPSPRVGGGRRGTFGRPQRARRAVHPGHAAHRAGVRRIRLRQRGDDRAPQGDQPLGDAAHQFYDTMVKRLAQDTAHVEHIQDFWGDPLTAGGSQSKDGKAAPCPGLPARQSGQLALSNQSVDSIRKIVAETPAPRGQGLRHRRRALITDNSRSAARAPIRSHRHHLPGDRGDAAVRLPIHHDHADHAVTVAVELAAARGSGCPAGTFRPD